MAEITCYSMNGEERGKIELPARWLSWEGPMSPKFRTSRLAAPAGHATWTR